MIQYIVKDIKTNNTILDMWAEKPYNVDHFKISFLIMLWWWPKTPEFFISVMSHTDTLDTLMSEKNPNNWLIPVDEFDSRFILVINNNADENKIPNTNS